MENFLKKSSVIALLFFALLVSIANIVRAQTAEVNDTRQYLTSGDADTVDVTIPDTMAQANQVITIPILVSDITGLEIIAAEIELSWDPAIMDSATAVPDTLVPAGWMFNQTSFPGSGKMTIWMAGTESSNPSDAMQGSGSFVLLTFKIVGQFPDTTTIHFDKMLFNEGEPVARTKDGHFQVTVPPPVADFIGAPTSGLKPLTTNFTDQSTGVITSWYWDFGDGATSTAQHPSHTYTTADTYTVNLTVTGPGGSDTRTRTDYIIVTEPPPVADFMGSPTSGVKPLTVNFTDQSTGVITSWYWDFGDGTTSTVQHPSHTYTTANSFTVSLTVTGPGGSDTRTKTNYIAVIEPPPVADFIGSPTSGLKPLTTNFTDQSTGVITSWYWDFGDGGTSTAQSPSHTYTTADTFTVSLTITGPGGSDTRTRTDYIKVYSGSGVQVTIPDTISPPEQWISVPINVSDLTGLGVISAEIELNWNAAVLDSASAAPGPVVPIGWLFNHTSVVGSGKMTIWLAGTEDQKEAAVGAGKLVILTFKVVGQYGDSTFIHFDKMVFNEGTPAAITQDGLFKISVPPPVAEFVGYPRSGPKPLTVTFTDSSRGAITSWYWDFGDGSTSTVQHPSHTYTVANTYTVSLTVTGPGGSDTETKNDYITVYSGAGVMVTIPDTMASPDEWITIPIRVSDLTGLGVISAEIELSWDTIVLDSASAAPGAIVPPGWLFNSSSAVGSGKMTIWLAGTEGQKEAATGAGDLVMLTFKVMGQYGDSTFIHFDKMVFNEGTPAAITKDGLFKIEIPLLEAKFSGSPTSGPKPLTVNFTDFSSGMITSWYWDFGDGSTSTVQHPSHTYTVADIYTVSLTVTGPGGSDTETKVDYITVFDSAQVMVSIPDTTGPPNQWISIPINVTDLNGLGVISAEIELSWDKAVLDSASAAPGAIVPPGWLFNYSSLAGSGQMTIWMAGTEDQKEAIPGGGELVVLTFKVVGQPCDTTIIHFDKMVFNEGTPTAVTKDGLFKVECEPQLTVTIPDTTGSPHRWITIPIRVTDTSGKGIDGADIWLSWNAAVLDSATAAPGDIIPASWLFMYNSPPDSGWMKISMAGPETGAEALVGKGSIVMLTFKVVGNHCDTTTIHFEKMIFNEGIPVARTVDGHFHAYGEWDILGNIYYYFNNDPVDSALVGIDATYYDSTDVNGDYGILDLSPDDYVVRPEKIYALHGALSAYDAAFILKYNVGLISFNPYQKLAADVTGNGSLSAYDASYILKYNVELINQFPVMSDTAHIWRFVPERFAINDTNWMEAPDSIAYTPLMSDTVDNYLGLVYGDVTGNWHPYSAGFALLGKSSTDIVEVKLEDVYGEAGEIVSLPLWIENAAEILSLNFTIDYDPNILKALGASSTELTAQWLMAHNIKNGQVKVAMAGTRPITSSGAIVNLMFEVLKTRSSDAKPPLDISEITINDGSIAVNIQSPDFAPASPVPGEYALHQNYPNPFNPETLIKYQLPKTGKVVLKIYNSIGQEIRTLVNEEKESGYHEIHWDGKDDRGVMAASGIYFYRIQAGEFVKVQKMLFLR